MEKRPTRKGGSFRVRAAAWSQSFEILIQSASLSCVVAVRYVVVMQSNSHHEPRADTRIEERLARHRALQLLRSGKMYL